MDFAALRDALELEGGAPLSALFALQAEHFQKT